MLVIAVFRQDMQLYLLIVMYTQLRYLFVLFLAAAQLQKSRAEPRKARSDWAKGASLGTAGLSGQEWEGELSGGAGAQYKLAGMSEEERQQMLDLREEVPQTTTVNLAVFCLFCPQVLTLSSVENKRME